MKKSVDSIDLSEESMRSDFAKLLLSNPNYFGNLPGSPYPIVNKIGSNDTFEELKCIGFNPQQNRLEGVVWIKKPHGFTGNICSHGSTEYVSFYLSYDGGVTWLPQGTASFQVFDVAKPLPLEYGVNVVIQPDERLCLVDNLPMVRAILSWNMPAFGPNATPVFGNVLDGHIQIKARTSPVDLSQLVTEYNFPLPISLSSVIDIGAKVSLGVPQPITATQAMAIYGQSVPAHRYLNKSIQSALANPAKLAGTSAYFKSLGVDVNDAVSAIENTNGSTQYEQLGCIGLDESSSIDALVGTLVIKLPTGYLGGLCTAGSKEYVAFWIDWGGGWDYQGTTAVSVFDITKIPAGGINYAVYLPVDLNSHRKACADGPVTAKLRAILSWDTPPPSTNPNYVPTWGNQLDTNILVNPGEPVKNGDLTPRWTTICSVPTPDIDQTSGFANNSPGQGQNPFGGSISINGTIPGAPSFASPTPPLPKYQVTVQQIDTSTHTLLGFPQILTDPFQLNGTVQIGSGPVTPVVLNQHATGGLFTYQGMNPSPAGNIVLDSDLLALWNSAPNQGTWQITLTGYDSTGTVKYPTTPVVIDLDQLAPIASLQLVGYIPGGAGAEISAADCQTFTVGDVIFGTYSVQDDHLGGYSLQAEPTPSPSTGFTITPAGTPPAEAPLNTNAVAYPSVLLPLSGASTGTWTYNTAGLPPCGYTIELFSNDRTIANCDGNWTNNSQFVGFCLVAP